MYLRGALTGSSFLLQIVQAVLAQLFPDFLAHIVFAFCRVQRTPMRFRADAVQSTTDALKQCIFSYSRGFITTV